jgi:uncharacterized Zn finger protein
MSYWGYPEYVSVAQKRARAEKKLKQLRKKMPDIKPVILAGNSLARSWWAKTWNKNLERYADYTNRIGRGRSYLRHGMVLDLKISEGKAHALVMGSTSTPYKVEITIKPIDKIHWQTIKKQCQGHLKSLQDLLAGKIPRALAEIFFSQEQGLFPTPKAIGFHCSCPDSASMCKHVAATLYGIGARFDEDPTLFFTLRGADTEDLIAEAIQDETDELLTRTKQKSAKVIDDADLADIFGIDMDNMPDFVGNGAKQSAKEKSLQQKPAVRKGGKPGRLAASQKKRKNIPQLPKTAGDRVAAIIVAGTAGVSIADLLIQTGYPKSKLYGIVHRLKQEGKIKNASHGVYVKA